MKAKQFRILLKTQESPGRNDQVATGHPEAGIKPGLLHPSTQRSYGNSKHPSHAGQPVKRGVRPPTSSAPFSAQSPSRYLGQEQDWRSPFESGSNPRWLRLVRTGSIPVLCTTFKWTKRRGKPQTRSDAERGIHQAQPNAGMAGENTQFGSPSKMDCATSRGSVRPWFALCPNAPVGPATSRDWLRDPSITFRCLAGAPFSVSTGGGLRSSHP